MSGTDAGGQGTYDLCLAVSPSNENEVYVGGVNVWRSDNGGISWNIKGLWYSNGLVGYIHADHHAFDYSPLNGALYSGNDGGIYKTYDKGENWTDLSNGLAILQIYRMAHSEILPELIIAGNQDNGTIKFQAGEWNGIIGGDGMECLVDYDDPEIIYGTLYYGDLRKSINGGIGFDSIAPPATQNGAWITPIVMHPRFPTILYAGFQKVYKTINGGGNWSTLSNFQSGSDNLVAIAVAPSNDKVLYISTRSNVYKSINDGASWTNITSGLPVNYKTSIVVSETDPNIVWISISGYSSNAKVYKSVNGGDTWSNYSTGLPNLPVNCMAYQDSSNQALYIGTDVGVYYRDASMSSWDKFGNGLPNVIVYDLEIVYSTGKLRAATHGRGVWQTDLNTPAAQIYTDFKLSSTTICDHGTVHISNYSTGVFDSLVWNFGNSASPPSAEGSGPFTVTYLATGEKSITLTGYKNLIAYPVTKTNILNVENQIDFVVSPDNITFCKGKSLHLYASGGYDFTWSPSELYDTATGDNLIISPEKDISIMVEAKNGSCIATKVVNLRVVSNDAVCDATLLTEGLNGPFTNSCATPQPNEPVPPKGSSGTTGCESQDGWCEGELRIDNSVWFKFVAPEGGLVSIQTDGFDDQIAVYNANTCNDLLTGFWNLLAANDDFPGKADYSASLQEISGLTPGKTYWLQVDGSYGGVTGTFTVRLNYFRFSNIENHEFTNNSSHFTIYPNPNDGNFTLNFHLQEPGTAIINIYSITGKTVYSDEFRAETSEGQLSINLSSMSPGFYIAELKIDGITVKQKFYLQSIVNP